MRGFNKAILTGNLTKDPETRYTQNGTAVTSFTVAVNRGKKGDQDLGCDFIPVVTWKKQAESCEKYLTKGSPVLVEGRIQTRNYDAKDGTKRYVTEVVAISVLFLGSGNHSDKDDGTKPAPMEELMKDDSTEDAEIPF